MSGHDTDRPFALVQITDPHLYADPQTQYRGWSTDAALNAVLQTLREDGQPIDALLLTGDLAQDEAAATYRRLDCKLRGLKTPLFVLPGNHDDPQAMQTQMQAQYLGEARLGAWRLLLLNSHCEGRINGFLPASELQRARSFVSSLQGPGLISLHHPPVDVGSRWIDALGLDNGAELLDCVAGQPWLRGIIFGHIHQRFDARHRGIRLLGCPSTWRQFLPGAAEPAEDNTNRPGYRRLWLHANGRLRTRIQRLKTDVPRSEEFSS